MKAYTYTFVAFTAFAALVGCAVASTNDGIEASDSAIRAMTPEEILGTIQYGETKEVDYTNEPRFRAFKFEGKVGDQVEVLVKATDATNPIAWVADDQFNTLAANDNMSVGSLDARVTALLNRTGTFYIIFRDANLAPRAKFTVFVQKTAEIPADCDPNFEGPLGVNQDCINPPDHDPFDAASCTGEPLTAEQAAAQFAAPTDLRPKAGRVYYRSRQCTNAGECSPWQRTSSLDVATSTLAKAPLVDGGAPRAVYSITGSTARKLKVDFAVGPTETVKYCVDGPFAALRNASDWSPLGPTASDPAGTTPGVCGAKVEATVTATCARFVTAPIQIAAPDADYYTEYSSVLLAEY